MHDKKTFLAELWLQPKIFAMMSKAMLDQAEQQFTDTLAIKRWAEVEYSIYFTIKYKMYVFKYSV